MTGDLGRLFLFVLDLRRWLRCSLYRLQGASREFAASSGKNASIAAMREAFQVVGPVKTPF
jgi:hypothetical protein